MADTETPDFLNEGEILSEILDTCDKDGVDYFEGFICAIGINNEDKRVDSARFIYNILCTDGQMSKRESITVLDNSIRGVFECIAEREH
jgi:hypothetical protein